MKNENNVYREALKKIMEFRARDHSRKSSRRLEDSIRIGYLAKLLFNKTYEVVKWEREERVLKMRNKDIMQQHSTLTKQVRKQLRHYYII